MRNYMNLDNVINKFDYKDKGVNQTLYDTVLTPLRCAWGGKTITCLSKETEEKVKKENLDQATINFKSSREPKTLSHYTVRVGAGVISMLASPLIGLALIGKKISAENQSLIGRYIVPRKTD